MLLCCHGTGCAEDIIISLLLPTLPLYLHITCYHSIINVSDFCILLLLSTLPLFYYHYSHAYYQYVRNIAILPLYDHFSSIIKIHPIIIFLLLLTLHSIIFNIRKGTP